jgi:hypothetical protein
MTPRDFKHCTEASLRLFVIVQMHFLVSRNCICRIWSS